METLLALAEGANVQFMPHGFCFLWTPVLLSGMVTADLLIAISYYSIPIALIIFAHKRGISKFNHLLWKFGLFIFLCGTTHLAYMWNIWHNDYYTEMIIKLLTGIVSFYVAISVWQILPQALKIPSVDQLEQLNTELAESETRYRELFEAANEGVWLLDTKGNTVMANTTMADILGTTRDELLRANVFDFVREQDRQSIENNLERRLSGVREKYEIVFQRTDGLTINTLISSSPTYDKDGKVNGILGLFADLTEKNKMLDDLNTLNRELEQRVQQRTLELEEVNHQLLEEISQREQTFNEQQEVKTILNLVFNSTPNGIIITDKHGIITDANVAVETMFGYRKAELVTKHVNMLTPSEFRAEHEKYIESADLSLVSKKLGFGRKLIAQRRYNNQFPVDIALTKIAHSEKYYYMAVLRDLTDIDSVEEELRSVNEQLLQTVESLREQSRETRLLNEYTEMLQSCEELNEYPDVVNSYCKSLFNVKNTRMFLIDKEHKLNCISAEHTDGFSLADCWALKSNRPYPVNEHQRRVSCKHLAKQSDGLLCLPLMAKGSVLGLLVLELPENLVQADKALSLEFEQSIQAFAVRTSISLANIKLLKEREIQSYKDDLTGLYNRRFVNETLRNYLPRAKRENVSVTVLMIDIDYFKKFNDKFGHNVGDTALAQVGSCIEKSMRETDLVARLGGEEFLAVLYDANENDGVNKAQDIHDAVATLENLPLAITVSIGVAQSGPLDDVESLIRNADMALYEAKEGGRNQTQRYTLRAKIANHQAGQEHRPPAG